MQTDNRNCRPWQLTVRRTASSALGVVLLLAAGAAGAGMYRWVDGSGHVHYGDTLPPTYQQSGAAEMNKQGLVIKRTQSEAERKAQAERQVELDRVQQAQRQQAQQDRALTQTYTSEAEIDLARDRALDNRKLVIQGAELRIKAVEANLADLNQRVSRIEQAGHQVGANLQDQVDQATKEKMDLQRAIQDNKDAMVQVREKYEADKLRFRELTGK